MPFPEEVSPELRLRPSSRFSGGKGIPGARKSMPQQQKVQRGWEAAGEEQGLVLQRWVCKGGRQADGSMRCTTRQIQEGRSWRLGRAWNPGDSPKASMLTQEGDEDDPRKGLVEPRQELLRRQAPTRSCGKKEEVIMNVRPTGQGHH